MRLAPYAPNVFLVLIIASWAALFLFSSPDEFVEYIGVDNGYLLVLLLSFISGLSVFGLAPYHLALIAVAAAGLNPYFLALLATLGLAIGDSTSYFLGYQGRTLIPQRMERAVEKVSAFLKRHEGQLPIYIFLYGALAPFSNDFVGVTLGLARHPFWRVMLPLSLGTLVFNTAVALSAPYAYELLETLLQ
ncbi:MAG: VTT domain-containing protein [bacterium]|nr:VTT domain-containing protein [bacterium]